MRALRRHPVLCSIILWACSLITYQVIMVNLSPGEYSGLNTYLVAVLGILCTVLTFAARWAGKDK